MSQQLLSRERVLQAVDLKFEDVEVPEWPNEDGTPGVIRLWQLAADESLKLTEAMTTQTRVKDGIYIVLIFCARDETGTVPVFTMDDIDALRRKPFAVLERLQRIALNLQGMHRATLKNVSGEAASVASPTA
jgi:hypothetical protein